MKRQQPREAKDVRAHAGVAVKFTEISAQTVPEKQSIDERIVYKIAVEKDKFVHTR